MCKFVVYGSYLSNNICNFFIYVNIKVTTDF